MLLSKISTLIDCKKIYNIKKKNTSFNFLSTNSKYIKKNSVLVINKKNNFKKKYIEESIRKGDCIKYHRCRWGCLNLQRQF